MTTARKYQTINHHEKSLLETEEYLDAAPTTGVHTGEPIILRSSINGNGICAGGRGTVMSGLNLVVLLLVLLDILCETLALLVELLVLSLDLGLAVLGVGTTAAGTVYFILLADFSLNWREDGVKRVSRGDTHVNSTFIRRGGYLPSSNMEWWYSFRQVFMRS